MLGSAGMSKSFHLCCFSKIFEVEASNIHMLHLLMKNIKMLVLLQTADPLTGLRVRMDVNSEEPNDLLTSLLLGGLKA